MRRAKHVRAVSARNTVAQVIRVEALDRVGNDSEKRLIQLRSTTNEPTSEPRVPENTFLVQTESTILQSSDPLRLSDLTIPRMNLSHPTERRD
jgi:hypothetical protein